MKNLMNAPRLAAGALTLSLTVVAVPGAPAWGSAVTPPGTFEVDSTSDAPDRAPGDGRCRTADGACTLRAAVMEANAQSNSTIVLPAGRYTLRIPPLAGHAFTDYTLADTAHGNLKIFKPTTIVGAGRDRTVIDGGRLDRIFTVLRPATISDVTITGGVSTPVASVYNYYGGGAALNASDLTMERVRLTGNSAASAARSRASRSRRSPCATAWWTTTRRVRPAGCGSTRSVWSSGRRSPATGSAIRTTPPARGNWPGWAVALTSAAYVPSPWSTPR
ncbi:hypothetical protein [Micromonospora sp. 4G55]|uniref:hypothetical protein n=1 Tax=Micromonospora sp. 4G55 TaxID=2806102 RepID=UPI001A4E5088|nr:hypothetical protein [Micromonospora sp. 4G55]MBM0257172.1 hypothetical protein [Micromonospora sp. 4G55]